MTIARTAPAESGQHYLQRGQCAQMLVSHNWRVVSDPISLIGTAAPNPASIVGEPRATLGAEAASTPPRSASISCISNRRSSTSQRPGRDRRVSSSTSSIRVANRGSRRAITIAGSKCGIILSAPLV